MIRVAGEDHAKITQMGRIGGDERAGHAAGHGKAVANERVEDFLHGFGGQIVFGPKFQSCGKAIAGFEPSLDEILPQYIENIGGLEDIVLTIRFFFCHNSESSVS